MLHYNVNLVKQGLTEKKIKEHLMSYKYYNALMIWIKRNLHVHFLTIYLKQNMNKFVKVKQFYKEKIIMSRMFKTIYGTMKKRQ